MGTMAKKINLLLIEAGITKQELAQRLGTTPSNLSGKLKRDNFSEAELQNIAAACGATFEGSFTITSTGKRI
jgi:DNA-binding Xre family transcriptional regulator